MKDFTEKEAELSPDSSDGQNVTATLENEYLRVVVEIDKDVVTESYYALRAGQPRLIARGAVSGGVGATYCAAEADDGNRDHVAADFPALFADAVSGKMAFEDLPPCLNPAPRRHRARSRTPPACSRGAMARHRH